MKYIAVLLTVFNRKEKTLECLERLYRLLPMDGYQVEVILQMMDVRTVRQRR